MILIYILAIITIIIGISIIATFCRGYEADELIFLSYYIDNCPVNDESKRHIERLLLDYEGKHDQKRLNSLRIKFELKFKI